MESFPVNPACGYALRTSRSARQPASARFSGLIDTIMVGLERNRLRNRQIITQHPPHFEPNNMYFTADNDQYLPLILNLIDQARESIKVDCFYIGGNVGETILEHLERKAQEGVKIYYRGDHSKGLANRSFVLPAKRRLSRLGRQLSRWFYHPFQRRQPFQVVGVNHNKLFVVDNQVALLTSKNPAEGDMLNRDVTMVIKGPMVRRFVRHFNWNWFKLTEHILTDKPGQEAIRPLPEGFKGGLEPVSGRPLISSKDTKHAYTAIIDNIRNAHKSIKVHAFCLTNLHIRQELLNAAKHKVPIQILINSSEEYVLRMVNIVTLKMMLQAAKKYPNLEIRAYKHKKVQNMPHPTKTDLHHYKNHNKMMIIDDQRAILGSTNFSNADVWLQENMSVELDGGEPVKQALAVFEEDWKNNSVPVKPLGPLETTLAWLSRVFGEF